MELGTCVKMRPTILKYRNQINKWTKRHFHDIRPEEFGKLSEESANIDYLDGKEDIQLSVCWITT
jgi:hypothetical protein